MKNEPSSTQFCTVVNCSTVFSTHPDGPASSAALDTAMNQGWQAVELWWPFASATPLASEIDGFCQRLATRGMRLHAMNLWGGDMSAGQRGVLHEHGLDDEHIAAVSVIAKHTGLRFSNLLLGRSGVKVTAAQQRRLENLVQQLASLGVTALVEPLSGMSDYPVVDPWQADALAERTEAKVLADFYHFAANGVDIDAWLADVERSVVKMPAHVQVADFPGRGAPGTGVLPLQEWIDRLRAAGYRGEVAGEWLAR